MHRRRFATTIALAGIASPLAVTGVHARQPGTPVATPVVPDDGSEPELSLAERVARIDPGALLQALRTIPVTSALLPTDTLPVTPAVWDEFGDTDLEGTLGGVVFNTGFDENDNFQGIGVAIVHPDAASAADAVAANDRDQPAESGGTLLGGPLLFFQESDFAVALVQLDYLLMGGNAPVVDLDEVGQVDQTALLLRAVSHLTALLHHLDLVLTALGA